MGSAEVVAEAQRFAERTPGVAGCREAGRSLPGGDSRSTLYHPPHPLFVDRATGSRVWDVDGHELVDLTNNHTALVDGNAHPVVLDAVRAQLNRGTCFSGPTELQVDVADRLTARLPGLERVRYCASGSEATLHAVRAARAFTGRFKIAKAEGAYHGSQDDVFVSAHPDRTKPDRWSGQGSVARAEGLGRSATADTVVFPFNDLDATVAILHEVGPDLAAVLVEPVMVSAGMIPADPGYLSGVRDAAAEVGALFVVDEVITLRLAVGGGQTWAGVEADLSCSARCSAVASRWAPSVAGLTSWPASTRRWTAAPCSATREHERVGHGARRSAATLEHLTPERIDELGRRGDDLRERLRRSSPSAACP